MGSFHSSRVGLILGETVCGLLGTYWQEKKENYLEQQWFQCPVRVHVGPVIAPAQDAGHRQPDLALHPPPNPLRPREGACHLRCSQGLLWTPHVLMAFAETADMVFRMSESPLVGKAFYKTDLKSYQVIKNILTKRQEEPWAA